MINAKGRDIKQGIQTILPEERLFFRTQNPAECFFIHVPYFSKPGLEPFIEAIGG